MGGGGRRLGEKAPPTCPAHRSIAEDGAVGTANAREIPSLTRTLLTNLAGHLGQWTASVFNAYSSPLSHWSCQSSQAVSSCHTPAPSQMYSDTDYANLYLVSPPVPALGAWNTVLTIRSQEKFRGFFFSFLTAYLICRDLKYIFCLVFFFLFTLHNICHIKGGRNRLWCWGEYWETSQGAGIKKWNKRVGLWSKRSFVVYSSAASLEELPFSCIYLCFSAGSWQLKSKSLKLNTFDLFFHQQCLSQNLD